MKDAKPSGENAGRVTGAMPLVLLPVWLSAVACFFYYLVRAGLPGQ